MYKVALLVAALLANASHAQASTTSLEATEALATPAGCSLATSLDRGCTLRVVDLTGDAVLAPVDSSALVGAGADVRMAPSSGDFQDAVTTPAALLSAPPHRDRQQPLFPALAALTAMVLLLRRRPTSF